MSLLRDSPQVFRSDFRPLAFYNIFSLHDSISRKEDQKENAFCYILCDKTAVKSRLLLAVMKLIFIASNDIWKKATDTLCVDDAEGKI